MFWNSLSDYKMSMNVAVLLVRVDNLIVLLLQYCFVVRLTRGLTFNLCCLKGSRVE